MNNDTTINIAWLYPDLMSTYGDRGNIIILTKRLVWRGFKVKVTEISLGSTNNLLQKADLIFMGGAQDQQQEIVSKDLRKRQTLLKELIDHQRLPCLFICGAYQFMGNYYLSANGQEIPGLGIFDLYTINPGQKAKRLIGNTFARINIPGLQNEIMAGFENHGGRTFLSNKETAIAKVITGYGNNGQDNTEGVIHQRAIGSYLHGPILAKSPKLADWLLSHALHHSFGEKIELSPLDDRLEERTKQQLLGQIPTGQKNTDGLD